MLERGGRLQFSDTADQIKPNEVIEISTASVANLESIRGGKGRDALPFVKVETRSWKKPVMFRVAKNERKTIEAWLEDVRRAIQEVRDAWCQRITEGRLRGSSMRVRGVGAVQSGDDSAGGLGSGEGDEEQGPREVIQNPA